ncbi:cutinase family protein [Bifidobacterium simiarum]|uniref:cutinase family protein n=1 Tax=Bifidobacterium simiarum TaxID=2045441 RepID=UPI001BDDA349|nr:cutinase family protein [Bifidobacterium simiarum]MBT1166654.1 cutinase family protein [Bifidobacterium simiarum]
MRRVAAAVCAAMTVAAMIVSLGACGSSNDSAESEGRSGSAGSSVSSSPSTAPSETKSSRDWGDSGCTGQAIRVIMARGTGEDANSGLLNPVAAKIAAAFAGKTQITSLDYPAKFDVSSVNAGVARLVAMLNGQAQQCPSQQTVLLGFSQGAIVTGDVLVAPADRFASSDLVGAAGTSTGTGNSTGTPTVAANTDELTDRAARNIAAVVMYGDPRFNGKASYNRGTFDKALDGSFLPRGDDDLAPYADRIADFCAARDLVCQQGGTESAHAQYFTDGSQTEGARFAIDRLRKVLG